MAHPRKALVLVSVLLLSLPPIALFAQAAASPAVSTSAGDLKDGLDDFRNGQFDKAILLFHNVILDPSAGGLKADAYFLMAKSYMALGKLDDAGPNLDFYLANYASAADYPEAVYQKGRLLFLKEDFEAALQVLQGFIASYPRSTFVSSAWYWAGESLYGLGRLDDAQAIYTKIVTDFPSSVKVEASQYKIDLIQLRKKEVELAKLLKWSHEDLLKTVEDYQNREQEYRQAIEAYQKRLAGSGTTDDVKIIADLRQQLAQKSDDLAKAQAQLAQASASSAAASSQSSDQITRMQQTLAAKEAALALKEQYLLLLDQGAGGGK